MNRLQKSSGAALGALLTVATVMPSAQAQIRRPGPTEDAKQVNDRVPPRPGNPTEVVVNCCKCIGEESGTTNISTGTAPWTVSSKPDPVWQTNTQWNANNMINGPTNTSTQIVPGNVGPNPLPNVWTNSLSPASWLQPTVSTTLASVANGHYTYQLKIRVPNCVIKQKVEISGRFASDDLGKIYLDGPGDNNKPITLSPVAPLNWPGAGFNTASIKSFSFPMQQGNAPFTAPGVYTIRVEAENLGGGPPYGAEWRRERGL